MRVWPVRIRQFFVPKWHIAPGARRKLVFLLSICFALVYACGTSVYAQTKRSGTDGFRSATIVTEPNAVVWIDGVRYGQTDENGRLSISRLAAGRRSIRVRAAGFSPATKLLLPAQKGSIEIRLSKTADQAELAYQQAEAEITTDRQAAAAAYKKAINLRPGFTEAYIGLARVYSDGRRYDDAAMAIKALRKIEPRNAEASVIEGRILKAEGEEEKAIAAFKQAIRQAGGFQPEAYTGLGLIYKERAESAGAAGEYETESSVYTEAAKNLSISIKQLSGAPDAVTLYQLLGLVYEQQKKFPEAIRTYQEFLQNFPDHPENAAFESFIVQLKKLLNEPK
jgi:tetratricopeptide (TPR) repeat protein